MARPVLFDLRVGGGSSMEVLYGEIHLSPTLLHSVSTAMVLPTATKVDLIAGKATFTNVAPSPAPVDGQVSWCYKARIVGRYGKTFEYLVGVPDGTTEINFNVLPRYFETKPPLFGQGPQGVPGEATSIAIGSVTAGPSPAVTNTGTSTDAILNFTLAQGLQGPKGDGTFDEYRSANGQAPYRTPAEGPNTYPIGFITGLYSSADGWPHSAFSNVSTFAGAYGASKTQIATPYNGASGEPLIRYGMSSTTWTPFKPLRGDLATPLMNGLMPALDKAKLDGMTPAANSKTFAAAASTYQAGNSTLQVRTADGWPIASTGTVVTQKNATGNASVAQWLYPVEGGAPQYRVSDAAGNWLNFESVATQDWVNDNTAQAGIINVKSFGAVGDGTTDDFKSVQAAFTAAKAGDTIFFPEGVYYTTYKDPSNPSSWLLVDKNNVTISGDGETSVLENFLIYIKGEYGNKVNLGQAATTGDRSLTSAVAHGGQAGDYYQLLSCVNAYSPDGGAWQLGSTSPTSGVRPNARYTEIVQVADVISTTSLRLLSEVVYPTYPTTSTGLAFPMSGIGNTEVRKLNMVKGVTVRKLTLKNTSATSFRQLIARVCADLTFEEVHMLSGPKPGASIKVLDSHNVLFDSCVARKDLDTTGGSSWNTIFIGGGCQTVKFLNFRGYNQAQCIDITPNNLTSSDWGASPDSLDTMSTMQFSSLEGCSFYGCGDGVTSHPGTYSFSVRGSLFEGGSTGVRGRSKKTVVQDNIINTARSGVALSAFVHDSLISDNVINIAPSSKYTGYWEGVSYSMCSSEIMNENNITGLVIRDNQIKGRLNNSVDTAISLSHTPPANLPEFTDKIRVRRSQISIIGNRITEGSVSVGAYINGTEISNNSFNGGSSKSYFIICETNSASNVVPPNTFILSGGPVTGSISTGAVAITGHGYSTLHRVAEQVTYGGALTRDLNNTGDVFVFGSDKYLRDGVALTSGAKISSVRSVGAAKLFLDAVPSDGSSLSTVSVFEDNLSSGVKNFNVYGRSTADSFFFRNTARILSDTGDPNGAAHAPIGSLYLRTDGGASTTLYVKTSGTGNTGWTAK